MLLGSEPAPAILLDTIYAVRFDPEDESELFNKFEEESLEVAGILGKDGLDGEWEED